MAFLLAFMTLITFLQVVLRYVFNTGLVWSLEATTYSFAALVLIGISYGIRTKTHIAVDLVTRHLPVKIRYATALVALGFCLAYAGLMLYGSSVFVERLYALGNFARDVHAPKWLLTITMPMGFALLVYRLLEVGWSILGMTSAEYCAALESDSAGSTGSEKETDRENLR
ncbi:MAG: TRAP transporter small permease [Gammaproteobacteria bacterium]|nr:TRAP transporter small permease [Gammaproteobacteria bacterium]